MPSVGRGSRRAGYEALASAEHLRQPLVMLPFEALSERGRVARLRRLAQAALPAFGLPPDPLPLLANHENVTFLHGGGARPRVAVRLHRHGYHDFETLRGEGQWLRALGEALPDRVSRPCPARDGGTIAVVHLPEVVAEPRAVSASAWLPGRPGRKRNARWAEAVGGLTACLHRHAATWIRPQPWRRPVWDANGLTRATGPNRGEVHRIPGLSTRTADRARALNAELGATLDAWGTSAADFGLIHADLHLHNVHLLPDRTRARRAHALALDFDDCGDGYWWYDAAVSTLPNAALGVDERVLAAWLAGYAAQRPLPPEGVDRLPILWLTRRLAVSAWFARRAHEPGHDRHLPQVIEQLELCIESWLDGSLHRMVRSAFGS